jgi:ABC-type antimicrobial peptide transport system permease subunit
MIAGITVVGAMVALAAGLLMSVERKKREFGLLRLYGFPPALLLIFVGLQSLILSGLALGSAMLLIPLLNRLQVGLMDASGGGAEFPVLLTADNIVDFSAGAAGIALAVSLVTGIRLLAIEPADAIRWR